MLEIRSENDGRLDGGSGLYRPKKHRRSFATGVLTSTRSIDSKSWFQIHVIDKECYPKPLAKAGFIYNCGASSTSAYIAVAYNWPSLRVGLMSNMLFTRIVLSTTIDYSKNDYEGQMLESLLLIKSCVDRSYIGSRVSDKLYIPVDGHDQ
jgi:hypothetical protein